MHAFDATLWLVQPALIVAALAFWGVGLRGQLTRWRKGFVLGAAGFLTVIAFEGASTAAITSAARREVAPILAGDIHSVSLENKPFLQGAALVALLRDLQHPWAHHSHPLAPMRARIETSTGSTEVWIARDSGRSRDYWVFYPGFEATKSNAIGHIVTDLLDGFTPSPAPEPASTPPSNPP